MSLARHISNLGHRAAVGSFANFSRMNGSFGILGHLDSRPLKRGSPAWGKRGFLLGKRRVGTARFMSKSTDADKGSTDNLSICVRTFALTCHPLYWWRGFAGEMGAATGGAGMLATDCWRASSFSVIAAICSDSFFVSAF